VAQTAGLAGMSTPHIHNCVATSWRACISFPHGCVPITPLFNSFPPGEAILSPALSADGSWRVEGAWTRVFTVKHYPPLPWPRLNAFQRRLAVSAQRPRPSV